MTLVFEDFPPGHFGTFGPRRVTREEMLAFAAEFDPQPMHLDEEAAKRSMLNGLSGSGWHLCSIMMRMMFDGYIGRTASLGSPGVNELRRLGGVGLAHRVGLHEAAGDRRQAPDARGRRARRGDCDLGTVARLSRTALDQAGAGRRYHQLRQRSRNQALVGEASRMGHRAG